MADSLTDIRIALRWPEEWKKANDSRLPNRSKVRNKLRKRYELTIATEEWRARNPNAFCSNCQDFKPMPHRTTGEMICDLETDFYGYALAKPTGWCTNWRQRIDPR